VSDPAFEFNSQPAALGKDARADDLSARWRVDDPEILRGCPVSLPG